MGDGWVVLGGIVFEEDLAYRTPVKKHLCGLVRRATVDQSTAVPSKFVRPDVKTLSRRLALPIEAGEETLWLVQRCGLG